MRLDATSYHDELLLGDMAAIVNNVLKRVLSPCSVHLPFPQDFVGDGIESS